MYNDTPIGTVVAYAGQIDPVKGAKNDVWSGRSCYPDGQGSGSVNPNAPLNRLEAAGWMLADGRYLDTAAYPELFAVIGFLYGQQSGGSGILRFRLPDYRGLFLRGADAGSGMDPDAAQRMNPLGSGGADSGVGSLQCDAFQEHKHGYTVTQPAAPSTTGNAAGTSTLSQETSGAISPARVTTETRPKNISVNYVIKFR